MNMDHVDFEYGYTGYEEDGIEGSLSQIDRVREKNASMLANRHWQTSGQN